MSDFYQISVLVITMARSKSSPKETEFDEKTERKAEPIPDSPDI